LSRPIEILEGVQKIDLLIKAMEDEERDYRRRIEDLEGELGRIRGSIEEMDGEAEGLRAVLGEAELRTTQARDRIRKNEEKIRSVSGNRELKALNKEITTAGKIIRQAEKDTGELKERLTEQGVMREARELEIERIEAEIENLRSELADKKAAWQEEAGERRAEREALVSELPGAMYKIYESIREKRGGKALALLRGEACQGCYMRVPPQTYVRLKRGDEDIIRCPHCDRILYVEDAAATEAS